MTKFKHPTRTQNSEKIGGAMATPLPSACDNKLIRRKLRVQYEF